MRLIIATALVLLAATGAASAADSLDRDDCRRADPARSIASCTRLIQDGGTAKQDRAAFLLQSRPRPFYQRRPRSRDLGFDRGDQAQSATFPVIQHARVRLPETRRVRPRHRRLHRGDPDRPEILPGVQQPGAAFRPNAATSPARSPTMTRRSGWIRKTPLRSTVAGSRNSSGRTTSPPSRISARRSGWSRSSSPPTPTAASPGRSRASGSAPAPSTAGRSPTLPKTIKAARTSRSRASGWPP